MKTHQSNKAVCLQCLAVFSNSQNRSRLVERVQGMLELYERPVIIVETGTAKGSPSHHQTLGASRYLDTIVCACTQVTRLKLLYSKSQGEAPFVADTSLIQFTAILSWPLTVNNIFNNVYKYTYQSFVFHCLVLEVFRMLFRNFMIIL